MFLDKVSKRATVQIVLTKCDMVNVDQLISLTKQIIEYLEEHYPLVFPVVTPTSSSKGEGIDQARGWVYTSTGLPERIALLNSINSAKAFSLREQETKITLSQINPDHPIITNQKSIPEELRSFSINTELEEIAGKQEKKADLNEAKKKTKKKTTKKSNVVPEKVEQKFRGQFIVGLEDFYK
ncbi:ribosome biogenesis protein EngB [Acrasis kona]|uniref:Ribosome biogenesis protein EngB n=1 Tax=Acrasis kona TaxID=1008807 RepID=A0AAW2Z932_9EUKA